VKTFYRRGFCHQSLACKILVTFIKIVCFDLSNLTEIWQFLPIVIVIECRWMPALRGPSFFVLKWYWCECQLVWIVFCMEARHCVVADIMMLNI